MSLTLRKTSLEVSMATVLLTIFMIPLVPKDSSATLSEPCNNDYTDDSTLLVLDRKQTTPDIDPTLSAPKSEKKSTPGIPKPTGAVDRRLRGAWGKG